MLGLDYTDLTDRVRAAEEVARHVADVLDELRPDLEDLVDYLDVDAWAKLQDLYGVLEDIK